jgi:hypothetical protein
MPQGIHESDLMGACRARQDSSRFESAFRFDRRRRFLSGWRLLKLLAAAMSLIVVARIGRVDYLLVGAGNAERLPVEAPRLRRRTVLTFPLRPPPQKN